MLALGVAGDLGADDAGGIGLRGGAAHPPDPPAVEALDFERAGGGAVVRTHTGQDIERQNQAPPPLLRQNTSSAGRGRQRSRTRTAMVSFVAVRYYLRPCRHE